MKSNLAENFLTMAFSSEIESTETINDYSETTTQRIIR